MRIITAFLLSLASLSLLAASDLPPLLLPQGVGVNIHFTRGHEPDLDLIAAAGFKFVRMDFGWGGSERKPGEYNWADYDELTANLEKRHLRPIYILDYSNGLYEDTITSRNPVNDKEQRDTASPQKPQSVAAFARWAAAAAQHYRGHSIVWEIWNEPNIGFWKPKPDVRQYTALALATCRAVREANPQATLIGPASSEFPWPFLESFLSSGVLEYLDAVSVHPYRSYQRGPETAAEDYLKLRGLIERYAPENRKHIPIVSGEWGYATHVKGVSLETQAAFIVRQQLANLLQGVPLSIWYDWKNDGQDPNNNEDNFGTVSNNLAFKPSYLAVQTLTRQLSGCRLARRLDTPSPDDFALLFVNDVGDQKLAVWTAGQPHPLSLELGLGSAGDIAAVDGQGQPVEVKVQEGNLVLALQAAPQYVTLKKPRHALAAAAAWNVSGFVPTLIEAGRPEGTRIPIQCGNPFDRTVQVKLTLESAAGSDQQTFRLEPKQRLTREFSFKPKRQSPESIEVKLRAEFQEQPPGGSWRILGQSSERRQFIVTYPMALRLAPVEKGVRLQILNSSHRRFEGTATINGRKFPVRCESNIPDLTVEAPATSGSISVELLEDSGRDAARPFTARFRRLSVPAMNTFLDGDAKVPARANLSETNAPGDQTQPFTQAWRLDYNFDAGWRFVRCVPAGSQPVVLEGKPQALGVWIWGDRSGNALRLRVTDTSGQTFQPAGPDLDWTGWRWVTFDLADLSKASHWAGANDGVVHGDLRLDTLLLVDGTRKKTGGTIYFAGATLIGSGAGE